jgi:hypothetical protein
MTHKYLKHKLIIVFLFFLFIILINQHIYKEGNTESSPFTESELEQQRLFYNIIQGERARFSESQLEQNSFLNTYIEAKSIYLYLSVFGKKYISDFNTVREKILVRRNQANDLRRQAAMAKERNQPDWKELSNHLTNQEKQVRLELDDLIIKYREDIKNINEIKVETENARVKFLNLEKEVSKLNIGSLSNS